LGKYLAEIYKYLSIVVESTDPPFSVNHSGISVPPPKKEILKGVFVIIIKKEFY
jgi:hypothetical protein